ncbi:AraC family transcriptional regulator [Bacterioplanoides sp. SCSIO 12839]|uniref:AraC family transcriptional regulator n=1 Tax=Bacterioplanoides sp. SCSIO 12839 TaxID=2829569 RepID=UPI0021056E79|nr:AraC family transcriptional regulator [Bacterioplanoides sp. SCSIO 12839]UTW48781.1 helix-turn-helix domain-containing protein [Bacterioplanoides sp. SCSIO 12839]
MRQYQADRIKVHDSFWSTLEQVDVSMQQVAEATRLPAAILLNQAPANTGQYFSLWDCLPAISGQDDIGIRFIQAFDVTQLPPSFFAAHIARNYRDALHRLSRFKRISAPESILIDEQAGLCTIDIEWAIGQQFMPDTLVDATFASLFELGRKNSKEPITIKSAQVTRNDSGERYLEHYLGCEVQYNAPTNRLILDSKVLDSRFISYNQELLNIVVPQLENELHSAGNKYLYSDQVKWVISQCLSSGCPKVSLVAEELGVGTRTLQRRITAEGFTFKDLLNEVRLDTAKHYLSDPDMSLFEIAALLGYEDQNSFYRAFKSWEGDSPSHWRNSFKN